MSTVRDSIPRASITSCACASDSGFDVLYGILIATTFDGPSALAAKYAVTAESTPPESPTTPRENPRSFNSSRRKDTSQSAVSAGSMSSGGGPITDEGADTTAIFDG